MRDKNFYIALLCAAVFAGCLYFYHKEMSAAAIKEGALDSLKEFRLSKTPSKAGAEAEVSDGAAEPVFEDAQAPAVQQEPPAPPEEQVEPAAEIKVYILGEVANPGVYLANERDRVEDVLSLAGGATDQADLAKVNLAEYVSDEQKIIIPKVGDETFAPEPAKETTKSKPAPTQTASTKTSGKININTASAGELTALPGVGESIAGSIVSYREANGAFKRAEDIMNVRRIGEKTFEGMKDMITVE
ncbi:MAG: helix-hairpin-helix domain-containing protein [Clostridiales bacterium]|jgi:competence protein ComEA|nr:helix-hairpin-helix domain-containing protein [Clostridiales bacterium]